VFCVYIAVDVFRPDKIQNAIWIFQKSKAACCDATGGWQKRRGTPQSLEKRRRLSQAKPGDFLDALAKPDGIRLK